jgi:hypothetical protein
LVVAQQAEGQPTKYLIPEVIRNWRRFIGLTQRECSRLFGGGGNSFSKYENGLVMQSEPMDNLLWLTMRYPALILDLARRRGVDLSPAVSKQCGHLFQQRENWQAGQFTKVVVSGRYEGIARALSTHEGTRFSVDSSDTFSAANDMHFVDMNSKGTQSA